MSLGVSEAVFGLTLASTYAAAFLARRHSHGHADEGLAGRQLNRWLVGLSAGTTANSGFVVTAAVGLGYLYGIQWAFLPLSWLIGDVLFWYVFPSRINEFGHKSGATTLSEILTHGERGWVSSAIAVIASLIVVTCLTGYTSAQWLAGQKFLAGAFSFPDYVALGIFALLIIGYSSLGGFRGSVYADAIQAIIRAVGTILAIGSVAWFAYSDSATFWRNIDAAGVDFLRPFPGGTLFGAGGFILGFAAAAVGFGLGQPQIVSRYLAGINPAETQAAWPIYIVFVQTTWLAMTIFGVILRGVMPDIADPESGLSTFFEKNMSPVATGIIVADVFATIASTSNGLLIAMAQAVSHDLLPRLGKDLRRVPFGVVIFLLGGLTMIVSTVIHGSVLSFALSSVSMMGAGLAGVVMIKLLGWRHSSTSLVLAMIAGIAGATAWKLFNLSTHINEAGVGMATALVTNWIFGRRMLISRKN